MKASSSALNKLTIANITDVTTLETFDVNVFPNKLIQ